MSANFTNISPIPYLKFSGLLSNLFVPLKQILSDFSTISEDSFPSNGYKTPITNLPSFSVNWFSSFTLYPFSTKLFLHLKTFLSI